MTKKKNPQNLKKRKTKLTGWSTLFQVVRKSTSRNLQKKRREIRLMAKKRTPQHLRKRKTKLTGWSAVCAIPRSKSKTTKKKVFFLLFVMFVSIFCETKMLYNKKKNDNHFVISYRTDHRTDGPIGPVLSVRSYIGLVQNRS